jgi:5-(carboxyamino)imidazole ribonucleotide synthase
MVLYPPIETVQQEGICRELRIPGRVDPRIGEQAIECARRIAEHIEIVGIMAIEFFVSNGELVVNELAPRPHNSGHWTIEGAVTSQFEQHLRAVLDMPLGSTEPTGAGVVTLNLLGEGEEHDPRVNLAAGLVASDAHVHFYGKQARQGRKIGHVTAVADSMDEATAAVQAMDRALFGREGGE